MTSFTQSTIPNNSLVFGLLPVSEAINSRLLGDRMLVVFVLNAIATSALFPAAVVDPSVRMM